MQIADEGYTCTCKILSFRPKGETFDAVCYLHSKDPSLRVDDSGGSERLVIRFEKHRKLIVILISSILQNIVFYHSVVMASATCQQCLDTLYKEHNSWLRNWLLNRLGCRSEAADLTQDTFVRLIQRDQQGIVVKEPRAYLTRIAQGLMRNHWRRQDVERSYLQALAAVPEMQAPSPEQSQLILETLFEIDAALANLRPIVRRAFLLAQLEGLKYRDIAKQLGIAEISVKRYVKQALVECLLVLT